MKPIKKDLKAVTFKQNRELKREIDKLKKEFENYKVTWLQSYSTFKYDKYGWNQNSIEILTMKAKGEGKGVKIR